jgi:hypothetical protein
MGAMPVDLIRGEGTPANLEALKAWNSDVTSGKRLYRSVQDFLQEGQDASSSGSCQIRVRDEFGLSGRFVHEREAPFQHS